MTKTPTVLVLSQDDKAVLQNATDIKPKYPDLKVKGLEWHQMGDTMTAYDPLFEKQVICTDIEQYEKERAQHILDAIDMSMLEIHE
jgi:hypothetical protein